MKGIALAAVVAACGSSAPRQRPEAAIAASQAPGASITPQPQPPPCAPLNELVVQHNVIEQVDGATEDQLYAALVQFLVTGGIDIATQDPLTHTVITKQFTGQTFTSSCGINEYRVYAFRIAVIGKNVSVNLDCWHSVGWEAGLVQGVYVQANRGQLQECGPRPLITAGDQQLISNIVEGVRAVLGLRTAP